MKGKQMSQETSQWLNTKVLVGFTDKRGNAWHYREADQGSESNHFAGAIPVDDVLRRLFNFTGDVAPVYTCNAKGEFFQVEGMIAVVKSDENHCFGIHSDGYQPHQYKAWLIDHVAKLVNGHTGIGTAGLLKGGAQAWVQIETPETYKTVQGVDFRSYLLATTSFDGSIASTYKMCNQLTVCDNTRECALRENSLAFKVKHTRNSELKIKDAQAALHLIETEQEAFAAEIDTLCRRPVSEAQFQKFLATLVPLPEKNDLDINKRDYSTRTATIAARKREALNELYRQDGRVAPWQGTAFGVLQAVNTYQHHIAPQRKAESRYLRNMENVVTGKMADNDADAMQLLAKICDWQLNRELVAA
jgi:phage/plasmid-like protein (TIGR03299 family)